MYTPTHFAESRPEVLHDLIRRHPLGILVTHGAAGLDANHIPFELSAPPDTLGILSGHVARANPVWRELADGAEVMVVFRAADAYISPNWYPSKHEQHKQVPTWNYAVAHVHGRIRIVDDERFVRGIVGRLTKTHEAAQPVPWKMGDSSREFIDGMLQAIVGIEIAITRLEGKAKLSQNKDARDVHGAIDGLIAAGDGDIAQAMQSAAPARQ